jgi:hypothetical protein
MDKTKVIRLFDTIDRAIRELAKETNARHISIYQIGDTVSINDYTDTSKPNFRYHKSIYLEDITINE